MQKADFWTKWPAIQLTESPADFKVAELVFIVPTYPLGVIKFDFFKTQSHKLATLAEFPDSSSVKFPKIGFLS